MLVADIKSHLYEKTCGLPVERICREQGCGVPGVVKTRRVGTRKTKGQRGKRIIHSARYSLSTWGENRMDRNQDAEENWMIGGVIERGGVVKRWTVPFKST